VVKRELSVLVLTEDTGDDAHATVRALVEKVLFLLEPGLDRQQLRFDRATERARAGMGFNCYKSAGQRDHGKKADLALAIARYLRVEGRDAVVFVHIDADGPWSTRDQTHLCDNARRFTKEIVHRVAGFLAADARRTQRDETHRLQQIALLVPFWTLESWLFQNTREGLAHLPGIPANTAARPQHFELWQQRPAPARRARAARRTTVRFGAKYNLRLASEGFPAGRLYQLGLSFTAAVEGARPGLAPLLADAHPPLHVHDLTTRLRRPRDRGQFRAAMLTRLIVHQLVHAGQLHARARAA
jgi:hypothetical protein